MTFRIFFVLTVCTLAGCAGPRVQDQSTTTPPAHPPGQYKFIVRDRVTQVAKGRPAEAIAELARLYGKYPELPEVTYALAMGHSAAGNPGESARWAAEALELGLPFGRFQAGPRDLLEALYATEEYKKMRRRHGKELIHGPMVGDITPQSARIWVRTASESTVFVRAWPSQSFQEYDDSVFGLGLTRWSMDRTTTVTLDDLEPDTEYTYEITVDGRPIELTGRPTFRTAPAERRPAEFSVGFGGGAGFTPWHEHMWDVIRSHDPLIFLLLGDNVYIDTPEVPATQRYCYYRRQSRPEFRRFTAETAIYAIWDDHDFGTNDCNSTLKVDEPAWKPKVLEVFKEQWANPYYGGGKEHPGLWHDFSIGDVDFFMLDCRHYRTDPRAENPTMLGPDQKQWLLQNLADSDATFKVIASSVPWAKGTKPGSLDTWDGYPEEREEIFSFIRNRKLEGVVLLSADRHRSDAWKILRPHSYLLYDLESSKLTNVHTHRVMPGSLFGYNEKCSFGLLEFDTTKEDPVVRYNVVNIDYEVVETFELRRSMLDFDQPHIRDGVDVSLEVGSRALVRPNGKVRPAELTLRVTNPGEQRREGRLPIEGRPRSEVRIPGDPVRYDLDAGQSLQKTVAVKVRKGASARPVVVRAREAKATFLVGREVPVLLKPGLKNLENVADALAEQRPHTIRKDARTLGELRVALTDDSLALSAMVSDAAPRQHEKPWNGSCLEVFGSQVGKERIGQVFLLPGVEDTPPKTYRQQDGQQVPAPDIRIATRPTEEGYRLEALIPLGLLALSEGDATKAIEFQLTVVDEDGELSRGTLFGSPTAYKSSTYYAHLRSRSQSGGNH